ASLYTCDVGHRQGRYPGRRRWPRGRRGRLSHQAIRARSAGGAGAFSASGQGTLRYGTVAGGTAEGANRTTLQFESAARGPRGGATGRNRADWAVAAVFSPTSGANDRRLECVRVAVGEPPARGDGDVLRLARLHRLYRRVRARRSHGGSARVPCEPGGTHLSF